jgi:hypothetical protein
VPPKAQPPLLAEQPPSPTLPKPQPLKLEDIKWRVVLVDGVPLFSLDARNYEALTRNMGQISSWVSEASWQLDFYVRSRTPKEPAVTKNQGEPK